MPGLHSAGSSTPAFRPRFLNPLGHITFMEIAHEIISVVTFPPSPDSRRADVSYWRKFVQDTELARQMGICKQVAVGYSAKYIGP